MTRRILTTLAASALAIFTVAAQPPGGGGPGMGGGRGIKFLTGYLTLTEAQQAQAKTIFEAADSSAQTPRGALSAAQSSLKTAVKGNATATIDSLAAQIGTAQGQLTAINAKAQAAFYAILTAEQKTKYDEMGNRGPGGPGRRGPR